MIIIRIFTDHHPNGSDTTHIYLKNSDIASDPDYNKKYRFTNGNDYTHVFLINCPTPNISHIPKRNVVGLAFEPCQFLNTFEQKPILEKLKNFIPYAQKYIGKYYIGDKHNLPEPFFEGYGYINPTCFVKEVSKTKLMSIMISNKVFSPGHKYRHMLVKEIIKNNLNVDIYGRGCKYYKFRDERLKGEFISSEPYDDYFFHIAIENFQTNHYFSEKVINPLFRKTVPVYLGCKNIDSYLPNVTIKLNGNIEHDIQVIKDICQNPSKFKINIDTDKIKETVSIKNIIKTFI